MKSVDSTTAVAGDLDSVAGKIHQEHLVPVAVSTNTLAYEVAALHLRCQKSPADYDEFKRTAPVVAVDLLLNQVHRRGPSLQFGLPNISNVCNYDHPAVDCSVLTSTTLRNNTRHCLVHPDAESTLHTELKDDNKALQSRWDCVVETTKPVRPLFAVPLQVRPRRADGPPGRCCIRWSAGRCCIRWSAGRCCIRWSAGRCCPRCCPRCTSPPRGPPILFEQCQCKQNRLEDIRISTK
jgi:hypothetical protein